MCRCANRQTRTIIIHIMTYNGPLWHSIVQKYEWRRIWRCPSAWEHEACDKKAPNSWNSCTPKRALKSISGVLCMLMHYPLIKEKNVFITILSAAIKVSSSFKLSPCTVIYNLFHAAASPFVPRLNFTVKGHWQSSCILRAMACNLCLSFNSTRNPISSDRITYERGEGTQNV